MQYELFFINITANYYVHFDAVLIAVALLLFHVIVLNDHLDLNIVQNTTVCFQM